MARRINKKYIEEYDRIIFTQPLAHEKILQQIYDKNNKDNNWLLTYKTDSIHNVCLFDGTFKSCSNCEGYEDKDFCIRKKQFVSSGALCGRINDCLKADLKVEFLRVEDNVDGLF